MTLGAVGLGSVPLTRCPTPDIHKVRAGIKVPGVNTASIPAEVVNGQPLWDRTSQKFIGDSVGHPPVLSTSSPVDVMPVPLGVPVAQPRPTIAGLSDLNLASEALQH